MDRRSLGLVVVALLAGAQARPAQPRPSGDSRPPLTGASSAAAVSAAQPTFVLMQTVQALRDLLRTGDVRLDSAARTSLAQILGPLERATSLAPDQAYSVTEALRAGLGGDALAALDRSLTAREQRARALLSRARLATPDGPVGLPLAVLSLTVPGGRPAVVQVLTTQQINPFAAGQSARPLLIDLLRLLERSDG